MAAAIRRDYTNAEGYICPTENAAIRAASMPEYKPPMVQRKKSPDRLNEEQLKAMDAKPRRMEIQAEEKPKKDESLTAARKLDNALSTIARMLDWQIEAIVLKHKGEAGRFGRSSGQKTVDEWTW